LPEFSGKRSTTEALCRVIFDRLHTAVKKGALGADSPGVARIRVTLHESHVARAWYEGSVARA